ncbi:N-acetylmuramoyl-L-alanine amidase [Clostridium sp. AM33-3]|nr:N-acetylmuramoyl-L-alanine amidase [Clostridium sp. AM33-3]
MERDTENERNRRRNMRMHILLAVDAALLAAILLVSGLLLYRSHNRETEQHLSQIQAPDWYTQDFLTVNPYSRPGTKREHVRDIVIHYVANPGTSAKQNRNYFEGLKDQSGSKTVSASSHYIIGSDGTILQCIPLDEVAYGNYPLNDDTVSIECCHPDSDGRFTDATIKSLIRLTGWLCRELSLNEKHIIRHYDVSGKNCPKYYVEHQDAWRTLKKKLAAGIQQ